MSLLEIKPQENLRVIDLVEEAGLDVSDWGNFAGGQAKAASNPKYCYEWCFVQDDLIVLNLWYEEMLVTEEGNICRKSNMRNLADRGSKQVWKTRGSKLDDAIRMAYELQLPFRVIVGSGVKRISNDKAAKASKIDKRLLDPVPWAVASYDVASGECVLQRGLEPVPPKESFFDIEQNDFGLTEGEMKERLVKHRKREGRLRILKINDALRKCDGRLVCEVPNCGFDFIEIYGALGEGYAQVHHKIPLSEAPEHGRRTSLDDLAIVCANCHVMIHRNGECRPIETLITPSKRRNNVSGKLRA
jgi:5-methylcytosine-specific restriction protein A